MRGETKIIGFDELEDKYNTFFSDAIYRTDMSLSDAHRMKELIADSDIVTVPAGHFSYIDSPGLVLGAMDAFLNE